MMEQQVDLEQLELFPPEETLTASNGKWIRDKFWDTSRIQFEDKTVFGPPKVMRISFEGSVYVYNMVTVISSPV